MNTSKEFADSKKINLDKLDITHDDMHRNFNRSNVNDTPSVIYEKPNYIVEKIEKKKQNHILFSDYKNYKLFYDDLEKHYNNDPKTLIDGSMELLSLTDIVKPLKYLEYMEVGDKYIDNTQYYRYIKEPVENTVYFGNPDAKKTTRLIALFLSIATEKKQANKYYDIRQNMLYLTWDFIVDFERWKYIPEYNFKYVFIDDLYNNMKMTDHCWTKFINMMRRADRNGAKIFISTNCNKELFIENTKSLANSFYSRFNETQFDFIECKVENNRRV